MTYNPKFAERSLRSRPESIIIGEEGTPLVDPESVDLRFDSPKEDRYDT